MGPKLSKIEEMDVSPLVFRAWLSTCTFHQWIDGFQVGYTEVNIHMLTSFRLESVARSKAVSNSRVNSIVVQSIENMEKSGIKFGSVKTWKS